MVLNQPVAPAAALEQAQGASTLPQAFFFPNFHPPPQANRGPYSMTYYLGGLHLVPTSNESKTTWPTVEITNRQEGMTGTMSLERHNYNVIGRENGTLYALNAGQMPISSTRVTSGTMPFLFLSTFLGGVGAFVPSLPQMLKISEVSDEPMPDPSMQVVDVLCQAYSGLFAHRFANFRPTPFLMHNKAVRPDVLYKVWWYAACMLGLTDLKKAKKPWFYMNLLQIDPRTYWETYETETGAPRHWLIGGDWWFRFKVRAPHQGALACAAVSQPRHLPE